MVTVHGLHREVYYLEDEVGQGQGAGCVTMPPPCLNSKGGRSNGQSLSLDRALPASIGSMLLGFISMVPSTTWPRG